MRFKDANQTMIATAYPNFPKTQMKNSYMHFLNYSNKKMIGGNPTVPDLSYTAVPYANNTYKSRTN